LIDLTIVIPSYETRALLLSCLESVEAAREAHPELSVEIIVVDNGSNDASAVAVKARFPHVRLVALVRNRGFARAVNLGLALRRGRAVLLLNSDVEIDCDLLADGIRILDGHPEVGVVGAALTHPDGRPQRSVHRAPGCVTEFLPEFLHGRFGPANLPFARGPGREETNGLRRVEAVRGAVFLIRGKVVDEVGAFNEGFFFFLEETEFCARVRRAGHDIVYADDMKAVHHLGASSKRRAPLATRIEFHRSLYRYLELERGRSIAGCARGWRCLRGGILIILLTIAYPFSSAVRGRMCERWGLFLWHLRGCPREPILADALAAESALERGSLDSGSFRVGRASP
jgi:GT2 family glycosyltransferase